MKSDISIQLNSNREILILSFSLCINPGALWKYKTRLEREKAQLICWFYILIF